MAEYMLFVSGEYKIQTGPGSFRLGTGGGGFDHRQHVIRVADDEVTDEKAKEEAMRIVQDYQDRLDVFRWESITSTRLFRLIDENLHSRPARGTEH